MERLHLGRFEDVCPLEIKDSSVDAVIVDPPFGTTSSSWDSIIPFEFMWGELDRVLKPNSPIVIKAVDPFSSLVVGSNISNYKHKWYWRKNRGGNFAVVKYQPLSVVEELLIFCNGSLTYSPQMVKGKMRSVGGKNSQVNGRGFGGISNISHQSDMRHPQNILDIPTVERRDSVHPNQTPVALWEYMLKTYTQKEWVILDFSMGSGSCGVACQNLGRSYIGIESDEGYFLEAKRRISREGTLFA